MLHDDLEAVWPGGRKTPELLGAVQEKRPACEQEDPPCDSSPAKQAVVNTVDGAHAEIDQPFGFGCSLLALKVDELGVVALQDEVKVLPSLAFA